MRNTKKKVADGEKSLIEGADLLEASGRVKTFKRWRFNKDMCSAKALASAGFVYSGKDSAKCVFCGKDLEWEKEDEPRREHEKRMPSCPFVQMGQPDYDELSLEQYLSLKREYVLHTVTEVLLSQVKGMVTQQTTTLDNICRVLKYKLTNSSS